MEYFKNTDNFFEDFIFSKNIKYIILTDEFDIIYRERPLWNDLYGNIYPFYNEINNFIKNKCILLNEIHDSVYPVRIVDFMRKNKYSVKIYKVKTENN